MFHLAVCFLTTDNLVLVTAAVLLLLLI